MEANSEIEFGSYESAGIAARSAREYIERALSVDSNDPVVSLIQARVDQVLRFLGVLEEMEFTDLRPDVKFEDS
jgi:hypothetical protein